MKKIDKEHFTGERALFRQNDATIKNCLFDDGESPLKEGRNLRVSQTTFGWKYPLWYGDNIEVKACLFKEEARAGIWYTSHGEFSSLRYLAPKGFRRCHDLSLKDVTFTNGQETLWWNEDVRLENVTVANAPYFGMGSKNVIATNLILNGDYAFDHGEDILIKDSRLATKDAFWNAKHIRLERCVIIGEYFGWNSEDVTLIDCEIHSTQGFCYMKGIKLINCVLVDTDRAFEYCEDIDADIQSTIVSIKNPISGTIRCQGYDELIQDDERIDKANVEIIVA